MKGIGALLGAAFMTWLFVIFTIIALALGQTETAYVSSSYAATTGLLVLLVLSLLSSRER